MTLYVVQSVLLGGVLVLIARKPRGFNTYQLLLAAVWTAAVIAIRFKYGTDQITFYSNDQETQIFLVNRFIKYGLSFSPNIAISDRYLVVIPVRMLDLFGIDQLLAFKFLQAISLSYIYKLCSDFLTREGIVVKLWHAIFFAGPLFIFLSTIGLRDLEIALFATYFFIGRSTPLKLVSLVATLLLRPHLALALIFGWIVANYLQKFQPKRIYFAIIGLVMGAFALGGYGYSAGSFLKYQNDILTPRVFEQVVWWRFFSNLVGLQFLTFTDLVVKMPVSQLIALRLFFVDTFAIPLLFVFTLFATSSKFSVMRIQVFVSFAFFLGLIAQTNFNSSRQNLPFLSAMGVLGLLGILKSKNTDYEPRLSDVRRVKSNS
jgi:hypothetical protein